METSQSRNQKNNTWRHKKGICKITSYYGVFTKETLPSQPNHTTHPKQTDGTSLQFSNIFTENKQIIQHPISQRAKIIFGSDGFSIIYNYLFIIIYSYLSRFHFNIKKKFDHKTQTMKLY